MNSETSKPVLAPVLFILGVVLLIWWFVLSDDPIGPTYRKFFSLEEAEKYVKFLNS